MKLINLPTDILNIIFNNLIKIEDKKYFSICNKYIYKYYGGNNLSKYQILNFLNNDYINFYKYLNSYKYDKNFLINLLEKSIKYIPAIYGSRSCGYYDMRFIFELMCKNICLKDEIIKSLNEHFYIVFYKNLKICFKKNCKRNDIIKKINKQKMLQSLKNNFKVYKNKDIYHKTYTKLINDINFYY